MNPLAALETLGLIVSVNKNGDLEINGLATLDNNVRAWAIDVARRHKAEIIRQLATGLIHSTTTKG